MVSLVVILVAVVARRPLPGRLPGALAAVLVGLAVYAAGGWLGPRLGVAARPARRAASGRRLAAAEPAAGLRLESALVAAGAGRRPGRAAHHAALRPGHDRRRHRLHRKRRGRRRRVRHPHDPPDRRAGLVGGGGLRRRDPEYALHRPAGLQGHGRPCRLHLGYRIVRRGRRPVGLVHPSLRLAAAGRHVPHPGVHRAGDRGAGVSGHARSGTCPRWPWPFCRPWPISGCWR